jgi:hypothetical protein
LNSPGTELRGTEIWPARRIDLHTYTGTFKIQIWGRNHLKADLVTNIKHIIRMVQDLEAFWIRGRSGS